LKEADSKATPKATALFAWRKEWLLGLLLLAAVLAAYQPVWHAGFIWDDDNYVTKNRTLHDWSGLRQIWFDTKATPQYYPLVYTTFWLEYHAWKLNPLGYHIVNVLLHALGSILLWRVLKRLQLPGAWLAAAIFALHPVNVESVAWITERKNVLSGVFFFAAAWAYLRFAGESGGERRRRSWWLAGLLLFVCALLSKTAACPLPVVLLLARWWKEKRLDWRDALPLVPFFIVGLWLGLQTAWLEKHHVGASGAAWSSNFAERCLIAGRALWFYAGKLVWPVDFTFVYPRWQVDARVWWQWVFPAAALAIAATLWFGRKRFGGGPVAALLIFAGTLFPVLGFLDVYYMRYSYVADHFQYLAGVGVIVLVAGGLTLTLGRWKTGQPFLKPALSGLLLLTLGALTWHQCGMYAGEETLWRATLAQNPGCRMAHNNLGLFYLQTGELEKAIAEYREALETAPDYAEARNNLGFALFKKGEFNEAIAQYRKALEINPDYAEALNNLGNALRPKGDLEDAIAQYRKALEINPDFADAHLNLGVALAQKGQTDEAIAQCRKALEINPASAEAHNDLGVVLFRETLWNETHLNEAIAQYRMALEIDPDYSNAHLNLAVALAQSGQIEEANAQYRKALELNPASAEAHNGLGVILLSQARLDEAIAHFRQALEINPRSPDTFPYLGMAFFKKGQIKEAMDSWQQALEINPNQVYVLNNLAWLLATTPDASLRNGSRAIALAAQASQLSADGNPLVLHTLAAAYAEAGSYGTAAVTARRGLELAVAQKNDALAATLQKEIKLYESGAPVRDAAR
jgi:tetratricopeptide (TPR) repeat protein